MRLIPPLALAALALWRPLAAAEPILQSMSLNACQENSGFSASLFKVTLTPNNKMVNVDIVAVSSVEGYVAFDVLLLAYGFQVIHMVVNPCELGLAGLCPMTAGKIPLNFNLPVSDEALAQIPGIAYTFPDLDATVRVFINRTVNNVATPESLACVTADISNGKTVDLMGVKWATALVAVLSLTSSAIVSGLGHQNAAAHVASNALSLFGYFQHQAMLGLTRVHLPPIVMAWTQDFQWSMGVIRVGWMQDLFTWYQRATGGKPATLFHTLTTVSVQVEKRALSLAKRGIAMLPTNIVEPMKNVVARSLLVKRQNIQTSSGSYLVFGIQRVAFKAGIETTNLFMTGICWFCVMVLVVSGCVAGFKYLLDFLAGKGMIPNDRFAEFRKGWRIYLKGILFRLTLIGFPAISILCLWEFTQKDSPALVVLAVFFFFGMLITLGWASFKVIRIAQRSITIHNNPAYILFSDSHCLNKWGFLYVQFRASAYYFIVPTLTYILLKAMFVAFGQSSGTVQAVGFLILDAAALIGASVLRPWMDKKTNSFNIAICAMNFINSIFLMIFSEVFNQPPLVTGVVGLVLWLVNSIFSLILLLMLIVSSLIVFFRENPDGRYQIMADDRTSFMKSQTHLTTTTELDALAATARGDKLGWKPGVDLDDDAESITSDSLRRQTTDRDHLSLPSAAAAIAAANQGQQYNNHYNNNGYGGGYGGGSTYAGSSYGGNPGGYGGGNNGGYTAYNGGVSRPRTPASPSMPLFPADDPRSPPRFNDGGRPASPYSSHSGYGRPQTPTGGGFRGQGVAR